MSELTKSMEMSVRGIEFRGPPDLGECRQLLETMSTFDASRNWFIGDILYQLEQQIGDDVATQVAAECVKGISQQKQLKCIRVAQTFDAEHRKWDLSWSHYATVLTPRLTDEEREVLLGLASAEEWPVRRLREETDTVLKAKSHVDYRAYFWDLYGAEDRWEKFTSKALDKWPREHMGTLVERAQQLVAELTESKDAEQQAEVQPLPEVHEGEKQNGVVQADSSL